ncbi:hypothetical protein C9J85_08065 [Haloferax sp. wsp5]|nr:hypothetical protein C9J85_08065 [Haloferax sp. wsp5]
MVATVLKEIRTSVANGRRERGADRPRNETDDTIRSPIEIGVTHRYVSSDPEPVSRREKLDALRDVARYNPTSRRRSSYSASLPRYSRVSG